MDDDAINRAAELLLAALREEEAKSIDTKKNDPTNRR